MASLYAAKAAVLATLLTSTAAQAQEQTPALADLPEPPAPRRTLLKVGTGLTRGFELGGFSGLSVPVVLGAEHRLAPNWTVYGNAFVGLGVLRSFDGPLSRGPRLPVLRSAGFDAGVRYYYHQAKRQAKGRAAGPFVGNYLALHIPTNTALYYQEDENAYRMRYSYTAVMGVWGLQRRLGGHGLLDAFVGAGLSNPSFNRYDNQSGTFRARRELGISTELGLRLSLVR